MTMLPIPPDDCSVSVSRSISWVMTMPPAPLDAVCGLFLLAGPFPGS